jgi:hypothetical protein
MKSRHAFRNPLLIFMLMMQAVIVQSEEPARKVDVCVYGATPSGILAAVAAKQEGCSVLLVEPSRWVGGILGAGIKPMQDCPVPKAVGGLTATHVFNIGKRPDVIRQGFAAWLEQEQIPIVFEQRMQRVEKSGAAISKLVLELAPPDKNGIPAPTATTKDVATIEAKVFIDASYEGDVMAAAGVTYAVGRESVEAYQETLAGVGPTTNWTPIDPYVLPGDATSGLLPHVDADHGLPKGAADDYTQAYNYRFYVTNDPARRIAIERPANYDAKDFELVGRFVEHIVRIAEGDNEKMMKRLREIFPGWRNRGECNYKRESLFTIAPLGVSRFYQDGSYEVRSRVWRQHKDYLSGLHHFLSTDARVPEAFRKETAEFGLDKTMHPDTEGWPNQLYVRIARRMQGPYFLTLADVWNQTKVEDGIGLALYGVDIFAVFASAQTSAQTVSGKFVGNGKNAAIRFVKTEEHESFSGKEAFTLMFTEKDPATAKKPSFDAMFGKLGSALILNVFYEDGGIFGCQVVHAAHQKQGFSSIGQIKIVDFKADGGRVSGRVSTGKELDTFGEKWEVDLTFAAPLPAKARTAPAPKASSNEAVEPVKTQSKPAGPRISVRKVPLPKDATAVEYKPAVNQIHCTSTRPVTAVANEISANLSQQGWKESGGSLVGKTNAILRREQGEAELTIMIQPSGSGSVVKFMTQNLDWSGVENTPSAPKQGATPSASDIEAEAQKILNDALKNIPKF